MTTPRDAIGLSERLRERIRLLGQSPDSILKFMDRILPLIEEAATALDALQARVKELEADRDRWKRHAQDETETAVAVHFELRTKLSRAEQERDKLQGMLLLCGELGGIGKDETPVAYLRRLIDGLIDAGRERDEALERLKPFAKAGELFQTREPGDNDQCVYAPAAGSEYNLTADHLRAARDLVRRLAAGTEKEGK